MKLYFHPYSQPSRTSLAVAKHLGVALEPVKVELAEGEQRQPEYLARNPNGKVPCLEVDGQHLWESAAIQLYLAEVAGEQDLWPADPAGRAEVEQWRAWAMTTWNGPLGVMTFQRMFRKALGMGDPDEPAIAKAEEDFRAAASILEAHLQDHQWVAQGRLTLADFALASMLTHHQGAQAPLADFPAIQAWYGRIQELPAWQETEPKVGAEG